MRGLQSLGTDQAEVRAVARVAVNLRGVDRRQIRRGDSLCTPGAWLDTTEIDVGLRAAGQLHRNLLLHIGSANVPVHVRRLGTAARLRLTRPLPLRIGDIGVLRDPGEHRIAAGIEVLDVRPPPLLRRGAARARAAELVSGPVRPPVCARADELRAVGFPVTGQRVGEWIVDGQWWSEKRQHMMAAVNRWAVRHDVAAGMPLETARQVAGLPAPELVPPLLEGTGLEVVDGLVLRPGTSLPARVDMAVRTVEEWLADEPFRAPEADELNELKLGTRELAAAVRAGRLTRIADGVVLGPDAFGRAAAILTTLPQPFTVSEARRALGTSRRVAVPLLEQLDARRITKPEDDGTRRLNVGGR